MYHKLFVMNGLLIFGDVEGRIWYIFAECLNMVQQSVNSWINTSIKKYQDSVFPMANVQ